MGILSRAAGLTGVVLIVLGGSIFLWKAVWLGLPVTPSSGPGPWRVELEVTARGRGERGSVRTALPSSGPGQVVFDEVTSSDRLQFSIRTEDDQRIGVWRGAFSGVQHVLYGFRAELSAVEAALPAESDTPPPAGIVAEHGTATAQFPATAPEIRALLDTLSLPPATDAPGRARALLGFVGHEVGTADSGSEDALLTLASREGSPDGKVRLLVTLLRAAGLPARAAAGLRLRPDGTPERRVWVEAWLAGSWLPMSPVDASLGRAEDVVTLRTGSLALVEATGIEAVSHRWRSLREHLRAEELATMMLPADPRLARFSLYRLPVGTQAALRILLLLPLGALVVACFRNLIGVTTFGTFMPILIALALHSTSLAPGLAMVAGVLAIGIFGRLALDRLRLLLVPRLSVLLCIVVLAVAGMALIGGQGAGSRELYGGVFFPMVILTMLIERFSVTLAEEGLRTALIKAFWSTLIAVVVYPIFQSSRAEHLMFGFPELVVVVMGVLVLIGGYMGYRLLDLARFRALARAFEDDL